MMRVTRAWQVVCAACVVAGCASGRTTGEAPDASPGGPDAKTWRDAAPVMPDAHQVAMPDAHVVGCHNQELLTNPVLDMNPSGMGWVVQNIDDTYPIITSDGFAAHSAPYKAWMGGLAGSDYGTFSLTDVLYQDVTIPANTTTLHLTGQYAVGTYETDATTYDTADVALLQTNASPVEDVISLTNESATTGWTAIDHTFASGHAGETLRVRLTSTNDYINETSFLFDSFSLSATICN